MVRDSSRTQTGSNSTEVSRRGYLGSLASGAGLVLGGLVASGAASRSAAAETIEKNLSTYPASVSPGDDRTWRDNGSFNLSGERYSSSFNGETNHYTSEYNGIAEAYSASGGYGSGKAESVVGKHIEIDGKENTDIDVTFNVAYEGEVDENSNGDYGLEFYVIASKLGSNDELFLARDDPLIRDRESLAYIRDSRYATVQGSESVTLTITSDEFSDGDEFQLSAGALTAATNANTIDPENISIDAYSNDRQMWLTKINLVY